MEKFAKILGVVYIVWQNPFKYIFRVFLRNYYMVASYQS